MPRRHCRGPARSPPQAIPGELCTGAAGVAGGECRGLAQALPDGNLLHAWPFVGLGPFSHGCRSGPQLLCVEPDSKASPLTSATLTPWLRERLLLKSSCPPPYQQSSQLRELSICLFKDAMQTVVGNDKQQMRKNVRRSLLPLFFHMSDQTESVAKVQVSNLTSDAGKGVLTPRGWPAHQGGARAAGSWTLGVCVTSGSNCLSH